MTAKTPPAGVRGEAAAVRGAQLRPHLFAGCWFAGIAALVAADWAHLL